MSQTRAVFALANTTSETQAMDAGIIKSTKGNARKRYVDLVLEMMDSDEQVTADQLKQDTRHWQGMMWMRDAWREIKKETIVN